MGTPPSGKGAGTQDGRKRVRCFGMDSWAEAAQRAAERAEWRNLYNIIHTLFKLRQLFLLLCQGVVEPCL